MDYLPDVGRVGDDGVCSVEDLILWVWLCFSAGREGDHSLFDWYFKC